MSYDTVQEEGVNLTQRTKLNFVGSALTGADNSSSSRTDVTLSQSPTDAGTVVGTTRQVATTAPLTGGGNLSADRTLALSITPSNDGGAVAKQSSTPGTAQTGHLNLSGTGTVGALVANSGDVQLTGNLTGAPSAVASRLDLGTRSMSSSPSSGQVDNRVGIVGTISGQIGNDPSTAIGSLIKITMSGNLNASSAILIDHTNTGGSSTNSDAIRINTNAGATNATGTGISIVNSGHGDGEYIGARGLSTGTSTNTTGLGIDVNRNAAGTGEQNATGTGQQIGINVIDWTQTSNNCVNVSATQHSKTNNINIDIVGNGPGIRFRPFDDLAGQAKGTAALYLLDNAAANIKAQLSYTGWLDLSQPGARSYASSGQSIATATVTAMTLDQSGFNRSAVWASGSNTRLTVPTGGAGMWALNAMLSWPTTGGGVRQLAIRKNGSSYIYRNTLPYPTVVNIGPQMPAFYIDTNVADGDYWEIIAYQDSGGNLTTVATDSSYVFFEAVKVG